MTRRLNLTPWTLTGPVLRVELVARRRHVDGVELDGNLLRRDGGAYLRAAQAYAERGRAALLVARARGRHVVVRQVAVDAPDGSGEGGDERDAQERRQNVVCVAVRGVHT